ETPPRPPRATLFPYTTLFRSECEVAKVGVYGRHVRIFRMDDERNSSGEERHGLRLEESRESFRQVAVYGRDIHACLLEDGAILRSEEHTSELQSRENLVCRLL